MTPMHFSLIVNENIFTSMQNVISISFFLKNDNLIGVLVMAMLEYRIMQYDS